MKLDMVRANILKEIIEMYQDTELYEILLQLLDQQENIVEILKSSAIVYSLISSSQIVWDNSNNEDVIDSEYLDKVVKYQRAYQLYMDYAYYFLGAVVVHPTLELIFDSRLVDYRVLKDDKIDYTCYLENINMGMKVAR